MLPLETFGGILALVCGVAAIVRRRKAIGGWLFYFFCQVLLGLALVAASTHWNYYSPDVWADPGSYFLFTLSGLSRAVLLAAVAVICFLAAETRAWHWIVALQFALTTYGFLTVLKLPVDLYCFPSATPRDAMSLFFPAVWIVYFSVSNRVRKVFLDKTWGHSDAPQSADGGG